MSNKHSEYVRDITTRIPFGEGENKLAPQIKETFRVYDIKTWARFEEGAKRYFRATNEEDGTGEDIDGVAKQRGKWIGYKKNVLGRGRMTGHLDRKCNRPRTGKVVRNARLRALRCWQCPKKE